MFRLDQTTTACIIRPLDGRIEVVRVAHLADLMTPVKIKEPWLIVLVDNDVWGSHVAMDISLIVEFHQCLPEVVDTGLSLLFDGKGFVKLGDNDPPAHRGLPVAVQELDSRIKLLHDAVSLGSIPNCKFHHTWYGRPASACVGPEDRLVTEIVA